MANRTKNDRALRFYHEVLGLERLHYGLWEPDDPRTVVGLKAAQTRYEQHLIDLIPEDAKSLLDVGCGTGIMSQSLLKRGYVVEGLSPDVNQRDPYMELTHGAPFHFCCFEEFEPERQYDCLILSESAQYIPLPDLFVVAVRALTPNGRIILADYFVKDGADGPMARSGHRISRFDQLATEHGFRVMHEEDITDRTTPTLDLARSAIDRYLFPSFNIATEKIRARRPRTVKLLRWFFRKKIASLKEEMALLDSAEFARCKRYMVMVLSRDKG
ncbi:MAG: methyltransferase domain-containing protein [Chlorobi bacterium]|nr:methyltransferase domain-containing protein [Chlorobiota bacterium]